MFCRFLICLLVLCLNSWCFGQFAPPGVDTQGWKPDPIAVAKYVNSTEHRILRTKFDKFIELYKDEEHSAFLYRALYRLKKDLNLLTEDEKSTGRLEAFDQGNAGTCVSAGTSYSINLRGAVQAYDTRVYTGGNRWTGPVSVDGQYGIIRRNHLGPWDGATGAWALKELSDTGILFMQVYGEFDLTRYSPSRAQKWARTGLPQKLIDVAKEYTGRGIQVNTAEEVRTSLCNGFPIIICCRASWPMTRSEGGIARRNGTRWSHCQAVAAYDAERKLFLIVNSWGRYLKGPLGPHTDIPWSSYWVPPEDITFAVRQGDSYCISSVSELVKLINWKIALTKFSGQ